jgi:radical SAM protein with 4Fe4S-binding SPASM domain
MSGEPLLHPQFEYIVDAIKEKRPDILVGLSTNGSLIRQNINGLVNLDYITVSVDSITRYQEIRKGSSSPLYLLSNIYYLLSKIDTNKTYVDLQLIELEGWEEEYETVKNLFAGFPVRVRTVPDCFMTLFKAKPSEPVKTQTCVNPYMSVSIHTNGDVVPCCFAFGDDFIYGSVRTSTLQEVWRGDKVRELRRQHQEKNYNKLCAGCYMRSPALLHWELFCRSIKKV